MRAAKERAIASLGDYTNPESVESAIARLQRDASHFWIPSETHWISLSRLLRFPVDQLRRAAGEV